MAPSVTRARKIGMEEQEEVPFGAENTKYWIQRYDLFEKYDEGIKMDKGNTYNATTKKQRVGLV